MRTLKKSGIAGFVLLILNLFCTSYIAAAEDCWIGVWVSAQQLTEPRNLPPAAGLSNNTLRQVIHVTLGGSHLRIQLSNTYGSSPVKINTAHIAVSMGASAIDPATDKTLTFHGEPSITIPAGEAVYSDTLDFDVTPLSNLAVSIYFGQTSADVTGHPGSRTTSYIQSGNAVTATDMATAVKTNHWYILSGIDLWLDDSYACVVTLGDSITDGRGSATNGNNRWPDNLARRLQSNPNTVKIGVLNQSIGGNAVVSGGLGPTALERFKHDVLGQNSVRWVIILEGVNDIGGSRSQKVAADLITAYEQFIGQAHAHHILVYGVPILPFGGSMYDSKDHEAARQIVNKWIRDSGKFDAVIDLDAAVRDPANPARLLPAYDTGDHLHLNVAGYQKMAEAIDLDLFKESPRERISINNDWRFIKNDPVAGTTNAAGNRLTDNLNYPINPKRGGRSATTAQGFDPTSGIAAFILPTGNDFIADPAKRYVRPDGNFGANVPYVSPTFNDADWQNLDLPHDFAIEGPFSTSGGGGMGRLPSAGIVWYRKHLTIPACDSGKQIYLDIDGSMSYTTVWCNGQIVGGWPYGYASWRVDLTPCIKFGSDNVLAIRLHNLPNSSRWYPGGGIYRNVWIVKTAPVHISHWGTYLTTPEVSPASATIVLRVTVDNDSKENAKVSVATRIFEIDSQDRRVGNAVSSISPVNLMIESGKKATIETKGTVANPKLWGTGPRQKPNRYTAVTTLEQDGKIVDTYETMFGIRTLRFDPNAGFFLNGEHIKLNGVCNHHDLGALGSAVNYRALQRQLEMLADMGCNAIRTSHNPPAPELLDLADKMGFLVMDEAFDQWARQKTSFDYHLVYPEWHEQDLRALLRRDRNHPSVIMWSIGNEVGEQWGGSDGAAITKELTDICHEEDPTRPTISGMNSARADSPFPAPIDAVGLNYQGTGVRSGPPQYPVFHKKYPNKFIVGSETTSTLSSRGVYTFPVVPGLGTPASATAGEEPAKRQVSSYDLYFASWSYSPDREFLSQDKYPYVGGEFVWTGWDYLGEPTPFDASRSSYFGIIDLAGFRKDRFYLYQAYWRPDHPMAHILPHWTWPERVGQVTPVHVYTSGDEAELFLNGKSLGRKKKIFDTPGQAMNGKPAYRIRWDDMVYEPGELKVVAYKDGKEWATDIVRTAANASQMNLKPDRATISADGRDLSFVTLTVQDSNGTMVPRANNLIHFSVSGAGEIVATDNGDATDFNIFSSHDRKAFNGLALLIIKSKRGQPGSVVITAESDGLPAVKCTVTTR